MSVRHSCVGLGAALMLALPTPVPDDARFALSTTGAVRMAVTGQATFGALPATAALPQAFSINLGATSETGALVLMQRDGTTPLAGRYAVREWGGGTDHDFTALFVAGSPAEPTGVFRGESGTVTITATRPGRIEGTFRIQARGFLAHDPDRDQLRVTLHGSFTAYGEQTVAVVEGER